MMLAFSCFCDAHFHLCDVKSVKINDYSLENDFNSFSLYMGCSSATCEEEFVNQEKFIDAYKNQNVTIVSSFGIHPQNPSLECLEYEEFLLQNNKISAIGEIGIDLFSEEFKKNKGQQEFIWNCQLDLALKYNKPIVIHCRKGMEFIFKYCDKLKKLPSVVFHSFGGSVVEAKSLLNKGINAFFSFGKAILNNNKNAINCAKFLPLNVILFETDAPYQTLKNEEFTSVRDICRIYEQGYLLREYSVCDVDAQIEFSEVIRNNFLKMFDL